MATVAQNITTINTQAAVLDGLITQFLAARAIVEAAEKEIRTAQPFANHDAVGVRIRLAHYAIARMTDGSMSKTCAQFASESWAGVS